MITAYTQGQPQPSNIHKHPHDRPSIFSILTADGSTVVLAMGWVAVCSDAVLISEVIQITEETRHDI